MSLLARRIVTFGIIPSGIALIAYLHASAIGALLAAQMPPIEAPPAVVPPEAPAPAERPVANTILARNMFDHVTGSLLPKGGETAPEAVARNEDPRTAPPCANVRALVAVRSRDADASFAALEIDGKRLLRHRGDTVGEAAIMKVAYVGEDRVWIDDGTALCQARIGAALTIAPPPPPSKEPAKGGTLEKKLEGKIVKTGPNEWQVDRGAVDQLLEAQAELMKVPLVPEKEGDRVVGLRLAKVKPGSAIAMIGLEENDRLVSVNGIEMTSPEKIMELYARLKTGNLDRLTINVVRKGKPTNLDYTIR